MSFNAFKLFLKCWKTIKPVEIKKIKYIDTGKDLIGLIEVKDEKNINVANKNKKGKMREFFRTPIQFDKLVLCSKIINKTPIPMLVPKAIGEWSLKIKLIPMKKLDIFVIKFNFIISKFKYEFIVNCKL